MVGEENRIFIEESIAIQVNVDCSAAEEVASAAIKCGEEKPKLCGMDTSLVCGSLLSLVLGETSHVHLVLIKMTDRVAHIRYEQN